MRPRDEGAVRRARVGQDAVADGIGRADEREGRNAERGGKMTHARIVAEEELADLLA